MLSRLRHERAGLPQTYAASDSSSPACAGAGFPDCRLTSGCSPPRLAATQLPSITEPTTGSGADVHRVVKASSLTHSFPLSRGDDEQKSSGASQRPPSLIFLRCCDGVNVDSPGLHHGLRRYASSVEPSENHGPSRKSRKSINIVLPGPRVRALARPENRLLCWASTGRPGTAVLTEFGRFSAPCQGDWFGLIVSGPIRLRHVSTAASPIGP